MFIFDSNSFARDPNGVSGKIPKMVEDCGGEMLASRLWNEQKLAYSIKGRRKGTYWLSYFRMDGGKLVDFNRACQLNDDVLRNLTLKIDPRLVNALVAHARGEEISTDTVEKTETQQAKETSGGEAGEEKSAPEAVTKVEGEAAEKDTSDESAS
jgi:small subunit ribosomal protein S6